MNIYIMLFLSIFIILYSQHRNKKVILKQIIKTQNKKGESEMLELAKKFIDKECIVYTFNSQLTGIIKEVSNDAILLENKNISEAINLNYIIRIREFPINKKGKKKFVVLD
ncbi:MAG: DUF6897 domain-containing protein [Clostridium paraputrificum]